MKNFTRFLISSILLVLAMAFNVRSQDVFKTAPVGIGTATPQQALDVAGNIKFSGALMPMPGGVANAGLVGNIFMSGGAAPIAATWSPNGTSGYVLGIASGVPTWVTPYGTQWMITGNTISTTYGVNFLGTTNTTGNEPLEFKANNAYAGVIDPTYSNVYLGGVSVTGTGNDATTLAPSASYNVAIGWASLATVGTGSSTGSNNYATAVGYYALHTNNNHATTTASAGNTAIGYYSAEALTTGYPVTAFGYRSVSTATTGSDITAFGYYSSGGANITTGTKDVSMGAEALYNLTTGSNNTGAGYYALYTNSTGSNNTAVGYQSLYSNSGGTAPSGVGNAAAGMQALYTNSTGYYNIGVGYYASRSNTTFSYNNAIGYEALYTNASWGRNVAIGAFAMEAQTTNGSNVAIGTRAAYELNSANPTNTGRPDVVVGDSALSYAGTNYPGMLVAIGYQAMRGMDYTSSSIATYDVAVGYSAMSGYTSSVTGPTYSTVIGSQAYYRSTGASSYTTVIGAGALEETGTGSEQIAIGAGAMGSTNVSESGTYNIAIGSTTSVVFNPANSIALLGSTLGSVTSGTDNLAIGYNAGYATTTGGSNVYIGVNSASAQTTGSDNTLIGNNTAIAAGTATYNTAVGDSANTAYGTVANTSYEYNTAIGADAIAGVSTGTASSYSYYNTAVGYKANASAPANTTGTTATSGTAIGFEAQALAANAIAIGASAYANTANTAILGSINGVNGASSNVSVGINTITPAQELEIGGTSNTIRIDGLNSGGSANFYKAISTSAGNILYVNNSSGDLYSLPNGTTGQQLILNSNGVPTWGAASFSLTATSPLTGNGYSTPLSISGTAGGALAGIGGTGSAFTAAGAIDSILGWNNNTGSVAFVNANTPPGVGPNDYWGHQVAETDSSSLIGKRTITGNGTTAYPLRLAAQGATNGEVLSWNSAAGTWKPATAVSSLAPQNITNGTAIDIGNGAGQVIGSTNINVDLQGIAGGVLTGQGASSAIFSAVGTAGYALTSNGITAPSWQVLNVPQAWNLTGNSGVTDGTNFLGTVDDKQLRFEIGGASYTGGANAGSLDPQFVGSPAVAFGNVYLGAPYSSTSSGAGANDQGSYNVGIGAGAMGYATSAATYNTAMGMRALQGSGGSATTGSYNVAIGALSLYDNSAGVSYETAYGAYTLGGVSSATAALYNTAIGYFSMYGADANSVYFGTNNTAQGYKSLYTPTAGTGSSNTAQGSNAAYQSTGGRNTAVGDSALYTNASGINNTALGYNANVSTASLTNANAIGANAYATQSNSLILGQINGINGATANTQVSIGTNTPKADAGLALKTNHFETQGQLGNGNVYVDSAAGVSSGASVTVTSATDMGGTISFTTGTNPTTLTAGAQITVFYGTAYTYPPVVTIAPANQYAAAAVTSLGAYAATATGSFSIYFTSAPAANTTYTFNYFILETPGVLTSNVPCCVPITLSNSQTTPTPAGFQQMLTVNFAAYSSMELSGLTNVEFSTGPNGTGTPLYAWIENGGSTTPATAPTTSSTAAIVWVNLGDSIIPAKVGSTPGTRVIYMDFMPTAVMAGQVGYTGEAPELTGLTTPLYGEYDNGAYVFGTNAYVPGFYDNFAGTSLDGNWTSYTAGTGITTVVNNGVTIKALAGAGVTAAASVISSSSSYPSSLIAESYISGTSAESGTRSYGPGLISNTAFAEGINLADESGTTPTVSYLCFSNGRASSAEYSWLQSKTTITSSPFSDYNEYQTYTAGYNVYSLVFNPTNNTLNLNYAATGCSTNCPYTGEASYSPPAGNMYFALGIGANYGPGIPSVSSLSAYWTRIRQYPPTAVMPTAVFGSTSCANSQPVEPNPCSVALTITNNQSTPTATGFQQLIQINSSTYSGLEMSGLQNVEFSTAPDGSGTQYSSWLESGNSSSSTNTVYWINLGSTIIPANGTLTIYMDFMSSNILSAGPAPCAGEAPQLSSTYAQYDNGGIVFPNVYTRWGGLSGGSVPTTSATGAINGGSISKINPSYETITNNPTNTQITYTSSVGAAIGVAYTTTPSDVTNFPNVLESYVAMTGNYMWFGTGNGYGEGGAGATVDYDYPGFSASYFGLKSNGGGPGYPFSGTLGNSPGPLTTNPNVWSILLGSTTTITSVLDNYSQVAGTYTGQTLSPPTYYGYFGTTQNGGTETETVYWTRTRVYPPNGTMPKVSPAVISCCPTPPALGPVSGNATFCPGQTGVTYSVTPYSGSVPITGYVWNVPTGSIITATSNGGATITVTFGTAGGQVTVQTTNSCGALGPVSYLNVTPDYTITAQPTNQSASCLSGSNAVFSVTTSGPVTSYQWQVDSTGTWSNITGSRNGVYSGYNTSTLTVSSPPFTMNTYQYQCVITGTCGGTETTTPVTLTVLGSVALTITNSQTTATPAGFQQMITFNSSAYTAQEMSGLQNVEFSTGNGGSGTLLQAWIESGNSNTATNTIYWVNLGSLSIPAEVGSTPGSLSIYMTFTSSSVLSATGPTGEAPQLSGTTTGTYGIYDNGSYVFGTNAYVPGLYDNFAGTTLNATNWSSPEVVGTCTEAVSNGITFSSGTGSGASGASPYVYAISSNSTFAPPIVAELYMTSAPTGSAGSVRSLEPGLTGYSVTAAPDPGSIGDMYSSNFGGNNPNPFLCWDDAQSGGYTSSIWAQQEGATSSGPEEPYSMGTPGGYNILGVFYNATSSGNSWWYNYTNEHTSSNGTTYSPTGYLYYSLGIDNAGGGPAYFSAYWARTRQYPPNTIMPAVGAPGAMTCCPSPPALGGISGATTFCPNSTGNVYSVTPVAGVSSYVWSVPAGAVITATSNGGATITVTFGSTSGTISVSSESACGTVGTPVTLTVTANYAITTQPVSVSSSCLTGDNAVFTVTTSGTVSTYQWQVDSTVSTTNVWSNITGSRNGAYSGYTTNTLTVSAPPFTMNGYEYRCIITGTSCSGSLTTNAVTLTVLGSIPITLTNNQTTATPANFQQMIAVNSANYTSEEMSGLQNVEFSTSTNGGGTPLQAWIESGNTNTSTNTIYWVNLGSLSVPAKVGSTPGSLVIYLTFTQSSVMSATGPTGEAPQLSGTTTPAYAEYDNGALVFTGLYDNFIGTSINAMWTQAPGDGVTSTANNGVTIASTSSSSYGGLILTAGYSNSSIQVFDCDVTAVSGVAAGIGLQVGNTSSSNSIDFNYWSGSIATGEMCCGMSNTDEPSLQLSTGIMGGASLSSSSQVWYKNYVTTTSAQNIGLTTIVYPALGLYATSNSTSISYQWARNRIYPPSGVMPTVSLGSLGCCSSPPSLGSISGSTSFCPGSTGNTYSVTPVGGVSSYVWTVPTGSIITGTSNGGATITVTFGSTGGNVSVSAVNACGTVGTPENLGVTPSYGISTQPVSASTACTTGDFVTFSVATSGTIISYQWQVDSTGTWSNITNSRNGVYSGYNTNILTVTSPPISMSGYQYQCVVTGTCGGSATSSPATLTVLGNIPITLINYQSTATSSGFQQQLIINSSSYSAQEMSGLQNVEFTVGGPYGTGTALQSWIESGNTSSATNTIYWVNLGSNIIPGNGTLTIYMNFMPTNVMSTAGPAGEAPDISSTYAQYDNGGLVFPNVYTRWGGNSGSTLPTTTGTGAINGGAISTFISGSYTTITTVGNPTYTQLNYSGSSGSFSYNYPNDLTGIAYTSTPVSSYTYPTVLESKVNLGDTYSWFGTGNGDEEQGYGVTICNDNDNGGDDNFSVRSNNNENSSYCGTTTGHDNVADYSTLTEPGATPYVWSISLNNNSGTDQITNVTYNYTQIPGVSFPISIDGSGVTAYQAPCGGGYGTLYGYFGTAQNGSGNSEPYDQIYWTRTRTYPPGGTMPSASLSGMECCSAPGAAGSISNSLGSTSFCPGAVATFSISAISGASGYAWTVPAGSTITANTGTSITVTLGSASGSVTVGGTNSCGEEGTTNSISLTSNLSITGPSNAAVSCSGGNASFTITAAGATSTTWQVSTNGGSTWTNVSNGVLYAGATGTTLTITTPPTTMNGYEYRDSVYSSLCTAAYSAVGTLSVSSAQSVKIPITNSASSVTQAGLQVMLTVNFSGYTSGAGDVAGVLNTTLNNVEFSTGPNGTGTPLYAWIENGSSSYPATTLTHTSTNAIIWVNLGALTIAASGTQNIYMSFMPSNVMTGTSGYTGEAPQLSGTTTGTYGIYDNGSYVFGAHAYVPGVYDNFAGTTLNSSLWSYYSGSTGSPTTPATFSVNNGLTITNAYGANPNSSLAANVISSLNSYSPPLIAETYEALSPTTPNGATRSYSPGLVSVNATTQAGAIADAVFSNSGDVTANPYPYICFSNGRSFGDYAFLQGFAAAGSPYSDYNEPGGNQYYTIPNTNYNIWSVFYTGSTTVYNGLAYDYTTTWTANLSGYTFNPTGNMYYSLGMEEYGASGLNSMASYWTRSRQYPPSNTLPTASSYTLGCY